MKRQGGTRRAMVRLAVACAIVAASSGDAFAQLDPLLFMKTLKPNVLVVVDTANRMQCDADNNYRDSRPYPRTLAPYEGPLGVSAANTSAAYRRKYLKLRSGSADKFETDRIEIVGDLQSGFSTFDSFTRMAVARTALIRAIALNHGVARFGLIRMHQFGFTAGTGNEGPVKSLDLDQSNAFGDWGTGSLGRWKISHPAVASANGSSSAIVAPLVKPTDTSNGDVVTQLAMLVPAGEDPPASPGDETLKVDAPVKYMLQDAQDAAANLIAAGSTYRNTVVVLVVGGGEGTTSGGSDPAAFAANFKAISGHRVPIYVVAIAPPASAVAQLQAIAANSGGQYCEITKAMIDEVTPGTPVPEFVRAVNTAVQHTFASLADFNTAPTALLPYGPSTEYQVTSPIVGTVNLANSVDINGNALENSVVTLSNGNVIPQRSNVLVTTGVAVPGPVTTPGFLGRLRAFRVYRPVPDNTKTSGFKFVGDGTALWVARTPNSGEGSRNIFTILPNGSVVAFTTDNALALRPYLNDSNPATLIQYIRDLPLGAFIDGTPAFLDAPSLDPPPDSEYPAFVEKNKDRRTLIFIGGNDGMLHAIDGRTGVEVWAFIPANLLPKLRALREGQPVDHFRFFVDGSPKIADVKVAGEWRTYMVFGEGPGGTFYQTVDVTLEDLGTAVPPDSSNVGALLSYFSNSSRIPFKWSFPNYAHFNFTLGDVDKDLATAIEKSVGQTWSDPAVGQVKNLSGTWVMLVGSGFLPYWQQVQANRAGVAAGTTFYVIDMATGSVLDSRNVGNDGTSETLDNCAVSGNCTTQRNALQADPVATGPPNSRFVDTVYMGDLDGRLWRFTLGLSGTGGATITAGPTKLYEAGSSQPLYSSMAVVNVGSTQQYVFFGTGSDLLPSTGVSQSYKLVGVLDQNGTGLEKFSLSLQTVKGSDGSGEKVSAYPAVAGDIVFFTTTTYKATALGQAPDSNVYALTFIGGPAYDNTGDNTVTNKDTPKVKTLANAGRATAPFVADQHLVLAVGGKVEFFGDPQDFNNGVGQMGVRILSWRDIR